MLPEEGKFRACTVGGGGKVFLILRVEVGGLARAGGEGKTAKKKQCTDHSISWASQAEPGP